MTFKKLLDTLFDSVKPQTDGKKRRFYDSGVENLLDFVTNYSKQDMANDTETQALIAQVQQVLKGVSPDNLRESDSMKLYIAEKIGELKQNVGALVQATGRKFR